MDVSDDDRRRMWRLAADLAEAELDVPASGDQLAAAVDAANRDRRQRGVAPLAEPDRDPPEEEFYRRARALGLR